MDYAETQIKGVIQTTIDKLLLAHKTYKDNDAGYSQSAYEILHTFMNNIHLTQSLIYSTVISKPFKINPVTSKVNAESLAQTVIKEDELFVPRIIKSGTIPAHEDKKEVSASSGADGELSIDLECEQNPAPSKQQTLDTWTSNTSEINNSHYVRRAATPPHRKRYVEDSYADFYGYDNSPPEYYEPNEESEPDSKMGWTYTGEDYEGEDVLDKYLANSEFARATTPQMPEEFRHVSANLDMDVQQCCARIGQTIYDVEEKDPEFMDSYPADTYRDMTGRVYGLPCVYMIPIEEFEKGTIFCPSHLTDYEDIRTEPKLNADV